MNTDISYPDPSEHDSQTEREWRDAEYLGEDEEDPLENVIVEYETDPDDENPMFCPECGRLIAGGVLACECNEDEV